MFFKSLKHSKRNIGLVTLLTVVLFVLGCEKNLTTEGTSKFTSFKFVTNDSKIKLLSYYNTTPEFMQDMSANADGSIVIPRNLLVPVKFFGVPQNPLIHTDRINSSNPVPVDMIVKVYNPNAGGDKYYEAPILSSSVKPSNVSTALSWLLRWGFGSNLISISQKQFDEITETILVNCLNCHEKSNTEVVNYILANAHLETKIVNAVNESNRTLSFNQITYTPPDLDYAWSDANLNSNWTILTSHDEPTPGNDTSVELDIYFVNPSDSLDLVQPNKWSHTAALDEVGGVSVQQEDVDDTPLEYEFDSYSSGLHVFTAQFDNGASQTLRVESSVNDASLMPNCIVSSTVTIQANRLFSFSVDQTVTPSVKDNTNATTNRLSTTEVSIKDISNWPDIANQEDYEIIFTSGAPITYTVDRTINAVTTRIVNATSYTSGRKITINDLSLFVTGTPNNGDRIKFSLPYDDNNNTNNLKNRIACLDPDPSIISRLRFIKSGSSAINITQQGLISWMPSNADVNTDVNNPTQFTFLAYDDSTNRSQSYTIDLIITPDSEPVLCSDLDASNNTNLNLSDLNNPCLNDLPSLTSVVQFPLNGTPVNEGSSINQSFTAIDADGDPIVVTVAAVSPRPSGYLSLINTTPTTIKFSPLSSTKFNDETTNYTWNFTPASTQINDDTVITGLLRTRFTIKYNTSVSSTLNSNYSRVYDIDVNINNFIGPPQRVVSSLLGVCGTTSCPSTVALQSGYSNNYYVLDASGDITTSTLTTTNTNTNTLVNGLVFRSALREGQTATILLPLIARHSSGSRQLYEITGQSTTSNCPFLFNGRTILEEVICPRSSDTAPGCLKLQLNYNILTERQDPLPYNLPSKCNFTISARNPTNPEARVTLASFGLQIQDVQLGSPQLKPTAVANIADSVSMIAADAARITAGQASLLPIKENQQIDIGPFFIDLVSDLDFAARNGLNPSTDTRQTVTAVPVGGAAGYTAGSTQDLVSFDPSSWLTVTNKIDVKFSGITSNKYGVIQESIDGGANWTNVTNIARPEGSALLKLSVSNDFTGTVEFQRSDTENFTGTNTGINAITNYVRPLNMSYFSNSTNRINNVNIVSFTAGAVSANNTGNAAVVSIADPVIPNTRNLYFYYSSSINSFIRVRTSTHTSGLVSAYLASNYLQSGSGTVGVATDLIKYKASDFNTANPTITIKSDSGFIGTVIFETCTPNRNADGSIIAAGNPCSAYAGGLPPFFGPPNPNLQSNGVTPSQWAGIQVTDTSTNQQVFTYQITGSGSRSFTYPANGQLIRARLLFNGEIPPFGVTNNTPAATLTTCSLSTSDSGVTISNNISNLSTTKFQDPLNCATALNYVIDTADRANINPRLSYEAFFPYFRYNNIANNTLRIDSTYYPTFNAAANRIRARVAVQGTSLADSDMLPLVTIGGNSNTNNTDFQRESLRWQCWFVNNPGGAETFHECENVKDKDGNRIFPSPSINTLIPGSSSFFWTPPLSTAFDNNLSSNANRVASGTILLRAIDNGFYDFASSITPSNTDCISGGGTRSCVDHRINLTVVETPAKPTIEVLDNLQNGYFGAKWQQYMYNDSEFGRTPTITVSESDRGTFYIKVSRYSDNIVDRYAFSLAQRSCQHAGASCQLRSVATPGATGSSSGFLISEPDEISNQHDLNTASSYTFKFTVDPNNKEGDTANGEYTYVYRITNVNDTTHYTDIQFRIKVNNNEP